MNPATLNLEEYRCPATLNLEEYRCRKCGRVFYIDATQHHPLDLDFGCPYGCDDNGERERDMVAEIRETADGRTEGLQDAPVAFAWGVRALDRQIAARPS